MSKPGRKSERDNSMPHRKTKSEKGWLETPRHVQKIEMTAKTAHCLELDSGISQWEQEY